MQEAINEELSSLKHHQTWTIATVPPGAKSLPTWFIFKKTYDADGNISRNKARLVVQGFFKDMWRTHIHLSLNSQL